MRRTEPPSFYLHNQSVRFDGRFAEIQKIGTLRLARAPRYPRHAVLSATVSYDHGQWHIAIVRDLDRQRQRRRRLPPVGDGVAQAALSSAHAGGGRPPGPLCGPGWSRARGTFGPDSAGRDHRQVVPRVTPSQHRQLTRRAECARLTYNWALSEWDRQYADHRAGLPAWKDPTQPQLTGRAIAHLFRILREAGRLPDWAAEPPARTRNRVVQDVERAWRNFFPGRSARPRPKRRSDRPAFYLSNQSARFQGRTVRSAARHVAPRARTSLRQAQGDVGHGELRARTLAHHHRPRSGSAATAVRRGRGRRPLRRQDARGRVGRDVVLGRRDDRGGATPSPAPPARRVVARRRVAARLPADPSRRTPDPGLAGQQLAQGGPAC